MDFTLEKGAAFRLWFVSSQDSALNSFCRYVSVLPAGSADE